VITKEKVVELLVYLMSEIGENNQLSDIDLADLKDQGYTQSEIGAAFSWLYEHLQRQHGERMPMRRKSSRGSFRVLHEAEKYVISTEAQGYLIQLKELGLLSDKDFESVLERAMLSGYEKVSIAELRSVVASILFTRGIDGESNSQLGTSESVH
jgi:Smg protein